MECVGVFLVFPIQVDLKRAEQMVVGWRKVRRVWWIHKNFPFQLADFFQGHLRDVWSVCYRGVRLRLFD
jgi:hypothetical protein